MGEILDVLALAAFVVGLLFIVGGLISIWFDEKNRG